MVVEELQILVGCDASTAEKVLTELETRLNRFVKQSASSMQNAKAIRAQAAAEREALKTEAARVKYANDIAKSNLALEAAQRKAAQAAEMLNEKTRKISASASEQSNAFEQMADGQCESLNKVAETAEEVERRLDEAMSKVPAGFGANAFKGRNPAAEAEALVPKEAQPVSRDLAEEFVKEANTAELFNMKLDELYNKLQRLLGAEEKLSEGGGTGQGLERVRGQILSVTEQIRKMKEKAKEAEAEIGNSGGGFSKLVAKAKEAAKKGANAFTKMSSSIKKSFSKLPSIAKSATSKTHSFFSKLGKAVGKILSRMIIWRSINAVIMGVQEGFKNMAQASQKANATLSDLQSGFTYAKNSIASAFLPALQAIMPVITKVTMAIANLFNMIGAMFAKLRGQSTFTKAAYVQQDYAQSLNKSNKAAKELKGTLAGFDQINLIQQQKDSGGGGAGDIGKMFEETDIADVLPTDIAKWIDKLKAAIAAGDWYGVGQIIAQGMNKGMSILDNWINNTLRPKGVEIMKAITDGMNGFIADFDWSLMGKTIADGMNAIIDILYTFWSQTDWAGLGQGLGNAINAWVENLDVALIAEMLNAKFRGLFDVAIQTLETVNWQELGDKVAQFIGTIDWSGLVDKLFEGIGAALGGLTAFFVGLIEPAWQSVTEWWRGIMEQAGGNVVAGLFLGIIDALVNIGTWIYEHICRPFIEGFKRAFGIHSPSTVMAEQGGYVIQGMLEGIKNVLATIGAWVVTNIFTPVMNAIKSAFGIVGGAANKLKEVGSAIIDGIKQGINNAWTSFKNWVTDKFRSVIDAAKSVFGIHSPSKVFAGIGGNIMAGMTQGIQRGKAAAVRSMADISKSLQGALNVDTSIGVPAFAKGGLVYGDTLAQVGEYANAKNNPEVIAPLDKLQSIMGGLNDKDTQTIIALLKRIADKDMEIALYPSAKLGRIVNQSVNMNNIAIGNV